MPVSQQRKPLKPVRYIILDSCIFTHLGTDELAKQIFDLLKEAVTKQYGMALCQISILELLDTASVENEVKAESAIKGLKHFKVDQKTLLAAGHLGCLYQEDGLDGKKQPEKGDKIIAGSAFVNNAVIFTTNGRDFPIPFFRELARPILKYKHRDGTEVYLVSYFLEPDLEVINTKFQERLNRISSKSAK